MSNLKHCQGCGRDLPRHLFPRGKDLCFNCTFNGPGVKEDVITTPVLEVETTIKNDMELVYLKHEEKIIKTVKEEATGMTRKDISRSTGLTVDTLYPLLRKLTDQGEVVMTKEVVDDRLMNVYYPPSKELKVEVEETVEEDSTERYNNGVDRYNETVETHNKGQDWCELKNRLITTANKSAAGIQEGLVQALQIMVDMEEEATP